MAFSSSLALAMVHLTAAAYYAERCAVVSEWWTAEGVLAEPRVGSSYVVFLAFPREGVSVSYTPRARICNFWCPGEVPFRVTYGGFKRVCYFESLESTAALKDCVRCAHYCAHRRNATAGDSSVDACLETSPLSPLARFWSASLLGVLPSPDVAAWLLSAAPPCLREASGVVFPPHATPPCAKRLAPACFANGTVCFRASRPVSCRIKAWGPPPDASQVHGCDVCVVDYMRADQINITYYDARGSALFDAAVALCPVALAGWGGETFVPAPAKDMVAASLTRGLRGLHVEAWRASPELLRALALEAARANATLVVRVRSAAQMLPGAGHVVDTSALLANINTPVHVQIPMENQVLPVP